MKTWTYQADLLCEDCTDKAIAELEEKMREDTGCSDNYPQGPHADGGGEADSPQTCGVCGLFLENPLTEDGREYVRARLREDPSNDTVRHWGEFYAVVAFDSEPKLIERMHGSMFYRTLHGWRRFIPDVVPLYDEGHDEWTLSGWVIFNTSDTEDTMQAARMDVKHGDKLSHWAWLKEITPH